MSEVNKGDIVTVEFKNSEASNTFIVADIKDELALLEHPLFPEILVKRHKDVLNVVSSNLKDSTERSLDFASNNKEILDYNGRLDLDTLCLAFVVRRKLTPKQKKILSDLGGKIAEVKFNGNIREAMDYITQNNGVLDDFNKMWYNNFSKLFKGKQDISSVKQTAAIFNMAGFVLAELETPVAPK